MKLYLENGELALPKGFSFEITHTNPFFSAEGASSLPATLPATVANLDILGHPEDTHRRNRPVKTLDAQLSAGLFFAKCKLVIGSASRRGGVDISLALKESMLYADIQTRRLQDIFSAKYSYLDVTLWQIYHGQHGTGDGRGLCVFPVASDKRETGGTTSANIINEPTYNGFREDARTVYINGNPVSVPQGYGVTAYLYLWRLIEMTFSLCGYNVTYNVFTEAPLSDIVVLHNTADSHVTGRSDAVRYCEMVPDITVGDLIGWLRDKFGAVVCAENGDVTIRLFKDIVTLPYDSDLTPFISGDVEVVHPELKRLELEVATGIESAAPAGESLQAIIARYPSRADVADIESISGYGLFHVLPLGKYYFRPTEDDPLVMVGSDAFKYTRKVYDITAEGIKTDDQFVPMLRVGSRYMPYIGASVRRHTDAAGDRDDNHSQQLMICLAPFNETAGTYAASSYNYDESGTELEDYLALTPEALLQEFWSRYQDLIINGCPQFRVSMDMPVETVLSMDITTPKRMGGDLVLVRDLRFVLDDKGITRCEFTLQQLAHYSDPVPIPDIQFGGELSWIPVNTRTIFEYGTIWDGLRIDSTDGLEDYTIADEPAEMPTAVGVRALRRSRWLTYTKYERDLDGQTTSWTATHIYEEYFLSTLNG